MCISRTQSEYTAICESEKMNFIKSPMNLRVNKKTVTAMKYTLMQQQDPSL